MALRIASVILGKKKKPQSAAQEAPAPTFQNEPTSDSAGETSIFGRRASRALSSRKAGSGLLATRLY